MRTQNFKELSQAIREDFEAELEHRKTRIEQAITSLDALNLRWVNDYYRHHNLEKAVLDLNEQVLGCQQTLLKMRYEITYEFSQRQLATWQYVLEMTEMFTNVLSGVPTLEKTEAVAREQLVTMLKKQRRKIAQRAKADRSKIPVEGLRYA